MKSYAVLAAGVAVTGATLGAAVTPRSYATYNNRISYGGTFSTESSPNACGYKCDTTSCTYFNYQNSTGACWLHTDSLTFGNGYSASTGWQHAVPGNCSSYTSASNNAACYQFNVAAPAAPAAPAAASTTGWPSSSFQCSGSGLDGYSTDHLGNTCPSQYPATWKWFGSSVGWAPPKSWTPPSATWQCPSDFGTIANKCQWWAPPTWWILPTGFDLPTSNWLNLGWLFPNGATTTRPATTTTVAATTAAPTTTAASNGWPAVNWQCNGSGADGQATDYSGNSCPSKYPSNWLWFGSNVGWGPSKTWTPPSANWQCPTDFATTSSKCQWWAPPTWWILPTGFDLPTSNWLNLGWLFPNGATTTRPATTTTVAATTAAPTTTAASNGWPAVNWQCNGSGADGQATDYSGNSCPSKYPSNWLWFGSNVGWGPSKTWTPPSASWQCPTDFATTSSKCSWWAPPTWWSLPVGFNFPLGNWLNLGWVAPTTTTTTTTRAATTTTQAAAASTTVVTTTITTTTTVAVAATTTPASSGVAGCAPIGWSGNGSGNDGYDCDPTGATCPYTADKLMDSNGKWKYFGVNYGWQPSEPWNVPYANWVAPTQWTQTEAAKATWWSPGSFWLYPKAWQSTSLLPLWEKLDSTYVDPYATSATATTTMTSSAPSATSGVAGCAPVGWSGNGSGNDGYDCDSTGATCPYTADKLMDSNGKWKYFGVNYGWQPSEPWNIPYANWVAPTQWTQTEAAKATWWSPGSFWLYPKAWQSTSLLPLWEKLDPTYVDPYATSTLPTTSASATTASSTAAATGSPSSASSCASGSNPQGFAFFYGYQSTVNSLDAILATSAEDCAAKCLATTNCRAFDYWTDASVGGQCGIQVAGGGFDGMQPLAGVVHGLPGHCETLANTACGSSTSLSSACKNANVCASVASTRHRFARKNRQHH